MRFLVILLTSLMTAVFAAPLGDLVIVNDGLDASNPETIQDDYIRLTLSQPGYHQVVKIKQAIDDWLGPGVVIVDSQATLKVQAPRASTERIEFLSALLQLQVDLPVTE